MTDNPALNGFQSEIIDEAEVYVTPNGLGRAAIVRRSDGLYCIYLHWQSTYEEALAFNVLNWQRIDWETQPLSLLYDEYSSPERGVFGLIEDARKELAGMSQYADAILVRSHV